MSGAHARLSASSAHRWLHCPGSVNLSRACPPTQYTAEGTFAHARAALRFEGTLTALGYSEVVDGFHCEYTEEMDDVISQYVDTIREDAQPGDQHWIEMPLLAALQKVDSDFGGTADRVRYRPSDKSLRVFDFKYGSGMYVEVDDNEQLKQYGLGVMMEIGLPVESVTLTIVQPRFENAEPVRDFVFPAIDIMEFVADVQAAAEQTRHADAPFQVGDHCRFCPAAHVCPELKKRETALTSPAYVDLSAIPVEELGRALSFVPLVKERIRAIEQYAYSAATQGAEIPGWKLVQKMARRHWKSEEEVKTWATTLGISPFAEPKLLSPNQIEDKLKAAAPRGKKKAAGKVLEPLVDKVSSGTALVPISDERPAVQRLTNNDFAAIGGAAQGGEQAAFSLY